MTPVARAQPAVVPAPDATLVARALRGDAAAFSSLYLRHARYIAGVARRLLGRDSEVDDVVQETFITAADKLATLRDPDQFRPWLSTIAVRRAHKLMSRRAYRMALGKGLAIIGIQHQEPEVSGDARAALERLTPKLRIPWILHRVDEATLPEVATMCEISLATAKRRIAEAEERLERWAHATR